MQEYMYGLPVASCHLPTFCLLMCLGAVPHIPNISNVFTKFANIGHRFSHQSGLYESSRQNPAAILGGFSFRFYLGVLKICTTAHISNLTCFGQTRPSLKKTRRFSTTATVPAASLFSCEQGLGIPRHYQSAIYMYSP